jgi:hypothetical protein
LARSASLGLLVVETCIRAGAGVGERVGPPPSSGREPSSRDIGCLTHGAQLELATHAECDVAVKPAFGSCEERELQYLAHTGFHAPRGPLRASRLARCCGQDEPGFARLDGRERLKARWPVSSCLAPYSARLSIPLIKAREQHAVEQHKRREPGCRYPGARCQERTGRQSEYRELERNPDSPRKPALRTWCRERPP